MAEFLFVKLIRSRLPSFLARNLIKGIITTLLQLKSIRSPGVYARVYVMSEITGQGIYVLLRFRAGRTNERIIFLLKAFRSILIMLKRGIKLFDDKVLISIRGNYCTKVFFK